MILNDEQHKVLQYALDIYGKEHQIDKCLEKMGELIHALMENRHAPKFAGGYSDGWKLLNVMNKIADVYIMVEQLATIFSKKCITEMIENKINTIAEDCVNIKLGKRMTSEKAKEFIIQSVKSNIDMTSVESENAIRKIQNGSLPPLEPIEGKRFGLQSMLP